MSDEEARERMRELADSLGAPPPELEARLRSRYRASRRRPWLWAVAAALVVGFGLGAWLARDEPPAPVAEASPPAEGFLLLDPARPVTELTSGRLVRVTLPPAAPAWFGMQVDPAADQGIEAEVLIGDDGVAQAVRFVQ